MKTIHYLSVAWLFVFIGLAGAQDASLVLADLKFTQDISTRFHIAAWVTLQLHDGSIEKFQYDRYPINGPDPGSERIKKTEGVFTKTSGKTWLLFEDEGAKVSPVNRTRARELDSDVNVVAAIFRPPTNRDLAQGGTVWRYVSAAPHGSATDYTFEESRERPKPGIDFPKYTFLKAPHDSDGRLFLCGVTANLRDDSGIIPINLRMTYLVPVPAGTKVQVFDKDTGKEKYNSVTGPDSGWEITAQTSEPPVTK